MDGNLISDGLWTYGWNAENRLTNMTSLASVPLAGQHKLDFAYDDQGRRIQKIVYTNSGSGYVAQYTNRFVYDGWNLIAEFRSPNSPLRTYLWGSGPVRLDPGCRRGWRPAGGYGFDSGLALSLPSTATATLPRWSTPLTAPFRPIRIWPLRGTPPRHRPHGQGQPLPVLDQVSG